MSEIFPPSVSRTRCGICETELKALNIAWHPLDEAVLAKTLLSFLVGIMKIWAVVWNTWLTHTHRNRVCLINHAYI